MRVKRIKLRGETRCYCCLRKLKAGESAISVWDFDEEPYDDRYYCNQRCYHGFIDIDTKYLLKEDGHA